MCANMQVCMHRDASVRICMKICIQIRMQMCMQLCKYVCIGIQACGCACKYAHKYVYRYAWGCKYEDMHANMHVGVGGTRRPKAAELCRGERDEAAEGRRVRWLDLSFVPRVGPRLQTHASGGMRSRVANSRVRLQTHASGCKLTISPPHHHPMPPPCPFADDPIMGWGGGGIHYGYISI